MRPLKFRLFDKTTKQMYGPVDILEVHNWHIDPEDVLMQFTGLSDKSGREIYEGDVIKFDTSYYPPCEDGWGREIPIQEKDREYFKTIIPDYSFGAMGWSSWGFEIERFPVGGRFSHKKSSGMEVIGNIYSNPELIK